MAIRILIVDDEPLILKGLRFSLEQDGYLVQEALDGETALALAQSNQYDIILLDVMLPKMSGMDVLRGIRERSQVPVIMLTAKGEEEDELQGFSLGADEYIMKPFSLKILLARIEAVFRRGAEAAPAAPAPKPAGLEVDPVGREVRANGVPVELTYTEFELLSYLIGNAGIALSRDKILDNVWRYDYYGDARTVDTHIKKLRSKLGVFGECIKTIRVVGYKYEP